VRRHLDEEQRGRLDELMREVAVVPDVPVSEIPEPVDRPDKDAPILAAAIAAGATHLITGDRRHFGPFFGERIGGVLVLPPRDDLGGSC
jgi:predicted nucleic acid-binding protein